jgi:hypothetical protein
MAATKWYDRNAKDNPPFLDALGEARDIAVREGGATTSSR